MLRLHDSRTRQKVVFEPLDPPAKGKRQSVGFYCCGPTVYDSLHIGHARAAVTPDVIRRYLEYSGYQVTFVTNFTDVDDKIIRRAINEDRDYRELVDVYIAEYHALMAALGNKPADAYPRCSAHIDDMLDLLKRIEANGHAYVAKNGDLYLDTRSDPTYCGLSGRDLDKQRENAGGRLNEAELDNKRNHSDFVLWKLLKNDNEELRAAYTARGDELPAWESPWGRGRPGWHIECSAMSVRHLGMPFDIHGGGQDLLFPHHEAERSQNHCGCENRLDGQESVKYWVHNAFINVKRRDEDVAVEDDHVDADTGAVKMSKSLGNVKWLKDLIQPEGPFDPMVVRMLLLSSHYRSPIVFEPAMLDEATARLDRLYNAAERLQATGDDASPDAAVQEAIDGLVAAFRGAMDDDFNTPGAISALFDFATRMNGILDAGNATGIDAAAAVFTRHLGVLGFRPHRLAASGGGDSDALIEILAGIRAQARAEKLWPIADAVRNGLAALDYEVKDTPDGCDVRKK
jgi:cysteinyl-tRNA synthetase